MIDQETALIEASIERELARTGYPENFPALPPVATARYVDQGFFDLEMQHVWRKSWLLAGHISELPDVGSYKLFEQLGLSVIVSRAKDGGVQALHNTCRHRGSALVLEPQGTARRFVCPYHSWGYALDGRLVSVPEAHDFACLDKAERGLIPVRCEVWRGLIFVNFDDDAQPLADFMAPISSQMDHIPVEDMVVKGGFRFEVACNWKAAYDNFLEVYHLSSVHADTIAPYLESKSFAVTLYENGHSRFVTRKKLGETIFGADLAAPEDKAALFQDFTVALPVFPNNFTALDPIGFTWQTFWPATPTTCVMGGLMLGWKADSDEDKALWEGTKAQIHRIVAEDLRLFPSIQRSLGSGVQPDIMMGCQERAIYWYHEQIDRLIGPANIPEGLRITPLLSGQVGG